MSESCALVGISVHVELALLHMDTCCALCLWMAQRVLYHVVHVSEGTRHVYCAMPVEEGYVMSQQIAGNILIAQNG